MQLERGKYTYQANKTDFEALITKAPTITRVLDVMQLEPGIQLSDYEPIVLTIMDITDKRDYGVFVATSTSIEVHHLVSKPSI